MLISELFHSIQGEGALTGVPSVFVRTSGCNLRCNWCDTPYASWHPEGRQMTVAAVMDAIKRYTSTRHVVLTGGEPMLVKELPELAAALQAAGHHVTIETAATIAPAGIPCDLASLSPKLFNSTPDARLDDTWRKKHEETRWQPEVVRAWIEAYTFQLKFVVASEADVTEIETMLRELPPVPAHQVLLMPEGTDMATLRNRANWLAELCKARGYRYAHRLHVELFGNTRGT
ncbi:MAG: 7-carboxy-7-deazaguanine synthase QueE [Opitutaceae bacterium]|nr:7-carboxy-7-deazaguanine synthase QueE [Cephaloticoccus sp.]MCP5529092.1 7-carboxy-7-deazaguanine synthase QueE [Opitutaceae bacterium]